MRREIEWMPNYSTGAEVALRLMASADQRWPNPLSSISRRLSQIQMLLHVGNQLVDDLFDII